MVHSYTTYTNSEQIFYEHTEFLISLGSWDRVVDYLLYWKSFELYADSLFPNPQDSYRSFLKFFIWILTEAWYKQPDKDWTY